MSKTIIDIQIPQYSTIQRQKGIIKKHRRPIRVRRRLSTKSIINFWDLGIYKDDGGHWQEITDVYQPGFNTETGIISGNLPMTITEYDILMDKIFSIPFEDWKDRYHKIGYEEAERYGFDLAIDGVDFPVGRDNSRKIIFGSDLITQGKWKDTGLEYKKIEFDLIMKAYLGFNFFQTSDTEAFKITEEDNYDDAEVEFKPKGELEIYLVPRVVLGAGDTIKNLGGSPPLLDFQTLVLNYYIMNRNYYLDNGFGEIMPLANYNISELSSGQKLDIKSQMIAEPRGSLGIVQHAYGYGVSPHPTPPDPDTSGVEGFADGVTFFVADQPRANYVEGLLLAVIRNLDKAYYVWSKNGTQSFNPSLSFTWS